MKFSFDQNTQKERLSLDEPDIEAKTSHYPVYVVELVYHYFEWLSIVHSEDLIAVRIHSGIAVSCPDFRKSDA